MQARQVVIAEPYKVEVREVELPAPAPNQILVSTETSVVSAGTELAVYTGTSVARNDPALPDWKFPFRQVTARRDESWPSGPMYSVGNPAIGELPRQPPRLSF